MFFNKQVSGLMHFIFFLGRFHVLALHLPITLILIVAWLEWLNRGGRRPELQPTLNVLWPATALTALLTMVLGYMHFAEGGFSGPSALAHRALGTSVAILATLGWILRSCSPALFQSARPALLTVLVLLVTLTGHFGGNLTHGDAYLVEYAPAFVRGVFGLQPERPAPTSVAVADAYLDVVRPIFQARCLSCHNADKLKGGLNLSTYGGILKGGKDGAVIAPGKADASDMVRRISLSPNDDDFMPNGKQALTTDQISLIRWWIDSGGKSRVMVGDLKPSANIQALIAAELHLGGATNGTGAVAQQEGTSGEEGPRKSVDPRVLNALIQDGLLGRPVSLRSNDMIVSPMAPGSAFSQAQVATLASVAPSQIVDLDLANADLTDAAMDSIVHLNALRRLKLGHNKLTDHAVGALRALSKLEVLSIYANAGITDASVETLAHMPRLRSVYLWQTGITPSGIAKLERENPSLKVDDGDALAAVQDAESVSPHTGAAP